MVDQRHKAIVEELLEKDRPSSQAPHLFVGLGGAGCRMVRRVADHLRHRQDFEDRFKQSVKFAFVDTNIHDLEKHKGVADELFLISNFEKSEYATLASGKGYLEADDYFTQWVPQDYKFRAGDTAGAGQIRIESRLGSYYQMKHGDFVLRFRNLLDKLKAHDDGYRRIGVHEIRVILCYSVAGGTGSGSHLPVAYMIRDQVLQLGKPLMVGVAIMPSVFDAKLGDNKDGTYANGYAALKETEHLMKLGAPQSKFFPVEGITFHYNPADTTKRVVRTQPFEFLYVIDRPESFSVEDPIAAAADGLYLQLFTPLFGEQVGDYDNYTQHQRFLVPHDFEDKGIVGFTSFYGSYGAAVLHVPDRQLLTYCSRVAALDVLRASFLGGIPAGREYTSLRSAPEAFYEIRDGEGDAAAVFSEAELKEQSTETRNKLMDALFVKRVQMLTRCEWSDVKKPLHRAFGRAFVHGHLQGTVPKLTGGVEPASEVCPVPRDALRQYASDKDNGWGGSIASRVLQSFSGGEQPALLEAAQAEVDEAFDEAKGGKARITTETLKDSVLSGAKESALERGKAVLERGVEGSLVGFTLLDDKKFMAAEITRSVTLLEKRYAALSLLGQLERLYNGSKRFLQQREPRDEKTTVPSSLGWKEKALGKSTETLQSEFQQQLNDASGDVSAEITREYHARFVSFYEALQKYAASFRGFQQAYEGRREEWESAVERMRDSRAASGRAYVLDAEALRIETGRRMWDFYYEDAIRGRDEVDFFRNDEISRLVDDVILRGDCSSLALQKLYEAIVEVVQRSLGPALVGDLTCKNDDERFGLQLKDALAKEVFYRALYFSNRPGIDAGHPGAVAGALMRYDIGKLDHPFNESDPIHREYVRDKIRRLVSEKANVLNYVDDKHLKQGGVRPADIFLALIDEKYANDKLFEEALEGTGERKPLPVLTFDRKQIVFYRALLNVPLFVFGRTKEMAAFYHQFRRLRRQSKVLHIDSNWEHKLADLDPEVLEHNRRMEFVRDRIVDFSALLLLHLRQGSPPAIVRREGQYLLRSPDASLDGESASTLAREADVPLGELITHAVEVLPRVLEAQSVRFETYQPLLSHLRQGLMPSLLLEVTKLPKRWRRNAQDLRNRYGVAPSPDQQLRIDDFLRASESLYEALVMLLGRLENLETERVASGDMSVSDLVGADLDPMRLIRDSIRVLHEFKTEWESPDKLKTLPKHLLSLFRPLDTDQLAHAARSTPKREDPSSGAGG
jgi:hypothetical protein